MKVIISKKKYDQMLRELTEKQDRIDRLELNDQNKVRLKEIQQEEMKEFKPKASANQLKSIELNELKRVIFSFWKSMDGYNPNIKIQQFFGKFHFNIDHEHATLKENLPE